MDKATTKDRCRMNIYLRIFVPAKSVPAAAVRQKMGILIHMHMDGVYYHERAESVVRLNGDLAQFITSLLAL